MKIRIAIICIACLMLMPPMPSLAVDQETADSLNALASGEQADTVRFEALNELCWLYRNSEPDKALEFGQNALRVARQSWKRDPRESVKLRIAKGYKSLGVVYNIIGNFDLSIKNHLKGLAIVMELGNEMEIAASEINLGNVYKNVGNYDKAAYYYLESLAKFEKLGEKRGAAYSAIGLGIVYRFQKDYELSLKYYNQAKELSIEIDNQRGLANCLNNMGVVYKNIGKIDLALSHYKEALQLERELGNNKNASGCLNNIGNIYKNKGDYETGLKYLKESLELREDLKDKQGIATCLANMGDLYFRKKEYQTAFEHIDRSLALATEIGELEGLKYAHELLAYTNFGAEKYEKAYNNQLLFAQYKDSIFNEEKSKEMGKLEAKYEFEKDEEERKRVEEEKARTEVASNNRRDNLQYSAIFIVIVFLLLGLFVLVRFHMPIRVIEGILFFTFLLFFEFTLVILDPYIEQYSAGAPAIKLAFNAVLAAMIFPLHSFFEEKIKRRSLIIARGTRMKQFLLILGLITVNSFSYAEDEIRKSTPKEDSLMKVLESNLGDSAKTDVLLELAKQARYHDLEKTLVYLDEALEMAKERKFLFMKAKCFNQYALTFMYLGEYDKAQKHVNMSLLQIEQMIEIAYKSIDSDELIKMQAACNNTKGMVYDFQSNYTEATKYYITALNLHEEIDNKRGQASSLNNLGIVYLYQNEDRKALEYFKNSMAMLQEVGDSASAAQIAINIGIIYTSINELDSALRYINSHLGILKRMGYKRAVTNCYSTLGSIYEKMGQLDTALVYQFHGLEMERELDNDEGVAISLHSIGDIYRKMGKLKEALNYYNQNLVITRDIKRVYEEMQTYNEVAKIHAGLGDYKKAYLVFERYSTMKDSIFNEDKSKEIGKLEARYEMEKEQEEIKRLEEEQILIIKENQERRDKLQYSGILIFIVLLFTVMGVVIPSLRGISRGLPLRLLEGMIFFSFLLFFEFTLVILDPYIEQYSSGAPAVKLAFNAILAAMIFPLHSLFEEKLKVRIIHR